MKNPFGASLIDVFQLGVICMLYRHVLTLIQNSQLLLKPPILDKFRLAMFHKSATQRNYSIRTGINQFRRNESSHDLESSCIVWRRASFKCAPFLRHHSALAFLLVEWNTAIITLVNLHWDEMKFHYTRLLLIDNSKCFLDLIFTLGPNKLGLWKMAQIIKTDKTIQQI